MGNNWKNELSYVQINLQGDYCNKIYKILVNNNVWGSMHANSQKWIRRTIKLGDKMRGQSL